MIQVVELHGADVLHWSHILDGLGRLLDSELSLAGLHQAGRKLPVPVLQDEKSAVGCLDLALLLDGFNWDREALDLF